MNYYLVNYSLLKEHARIVIPLNNNPNEDLLKLYIAEIKSRPEIFDTLEIKDYRQVSEDVYNLISPFINGGFQEDKTIY
jgi:hypothetical protein